MTPSFNQGRFLERTIQSLLAQGYPALEHIIQDGGSTDETLEILERYRPRLHHVASAKDRGQSHALNLGFQNATGEVLAYLNSDDLLLPGTLHYVARFFSEHPDVDVIYGHRIVIEENDLEVGRWILPPHEDSAFVWNDYVPQETLFWRRRIWEKAGGRIAEDYDSAMDLEMLWRFHRAGARFYRLPRFLGAFRLHPQQKSDLHPQRKSDLLRPERGIPELKELRRTFHQRDVSNWETRVRVIPYLAKHWILTWLYRLGVLQY